MGHYFRSYNTSQFLLLPQFGWLASPGALGRCISDTIDAPSRREEGPQTAREGRTRAKGWPSKGLTHRQERERKLKFKTGKMMFKLRAQIVETVLDQVKDCRGAWPAPIGLDVSATVGVREVVLSWRENSWSAVDLVRNRFGIEPGLTTKLARLNPLAYEVFVSCSGRTCSEGKRSGRRDDFEAVASVARFGVGRLRRGVAS